MLNVAKVIRTIEDSTSLTLKYVDYKNRPITIVCQKLSIEKNKDTIRLPKILTKNRSMAFIIPGKINVFHVVKLKTIKEIIYKSITYTF